MRGDREGVAGLCLDRCDPDRIRPRGHSAAPAAGNEEQKAKYLGGLASGKAVSFALTEVGAGSDAARIQTTAVREGDRWRIRGEKIYIGNGGASQYYVVFALTDPEAGTRGITAFMVDKDAEGVVIDHLEDKMGIRGTQTSNLKLDTLVDDVGHPGRDEPRHATGDADPQRRPDLGGRPVSGRRAGRVRRGEQRGHAAGDVRRPIIDNQGIAFPLADVATELTAAAHDHRRGGSRLRPRRRRLGSRRDGQAVRKRSGAPRRRRGSPGVRRRWLLQAVPR